MKKKLASRDVAWAYRMLLDREPESRRVVREWREKAADRRGLAWEFLNSYEFKLKHPTLRFPALSGLEPGMPIDMELSPAEMEALFRHVQETWERLGQEEPHFSVFTADAFKPASIRENMAGFYATGEYDCRCLLQTLERNGVDVARLRTCLEFGCGVGRVTRWLCGHFAKVHGVDISEAYLRVAREYFAAENIANVEFSHLARVQDIEALPRVDLVYSIIVLQHNPPPVMSRIVRGFLRALNPGGVAFFQVPTFREGYAFRLREYLAGAAREQKMEMHVLPQRHIFAIVQEEGGRPLEVMENVMTGVVTFKEMSSTFVIQKA